jgi:hypothetical protein
MRHTNNETPDQRSDRLAREAAARAGRPLPNDDGQVNPLVAAPIHRQQHGAPIQMSAATQETAHRAIQHLEVVRQHLHDLQENALRDQADDMIDTLSAKYGRPEAPGGTENSAGDRLAARAKRVVQSRAGTGSR